MSGEPTRIGFDVDREINSRIDAKLPWGLKGEVFRCLALLIAEALEEHGLGIVTLLTENKLELKLRKDNG